VRFWAICTPTPTIKKRNIKNGAVFPGVFRSEIKYFQWEETFICVKNGHDKKGTKQNESSFTVFPVHQRVRKTSQQKQLLSWPTSKKEDGDSFFVSVCLDSSQSLSIAGRFKVIGFDSSLVTVNIISECMPPSFLRFNRRFPFSTIV